MIIEDSEDLDRGAKCERRQTKRSVYFSRGLAQNHACTMVIEFHFSIDVFFTISDAVPLAIEKKVVQSFAIVTVWPYTMHSRA